jgi:hypothetical protein
MNPCLQCTIIRTTELAAAQEKFNEVHKQEINLKAVYSPAVLLERLHGEQLFIKLNNHAVWES